MTRVGCTAVEFIGTAFLVAAVVGSGIMGERLAGGNAAVALLANSLATGGMLVALLAAAQPLSGAHFNPAVTVLAAFHGRLGWSEVPGYVAAQFAGAVVGVVSANIMFGLPPIELATNVRAGPNLIASEFVATTGLLLVILAVSHYRPSAAPYAVAGYIVSAYWFTASTSFANPAITIARSLSNSFTGIRPVDTLGFLLAQFMAVVVVALVPYSGRGRAHRSLDGGRDQQAG